MAEDVAPKPEGGHVKGFLGQQTAGLPNWAWLLIIVAGFGLAYIVPRFMSGKGTGQSTQGTGSGLGLAIDPTTGLPYAVEGLVPSGAMAGTSSGMTGTPSTVTETTTGEGGSPWQNYEGTSNWSNSSSNNNTGSSIPTPSPSMLMQAEARSKNSRPEVRDWDAQNKGIVVRSSPGGAVKKTLGYNTVITLSGQPIQGPYNLPNNAGSNMWYPVSGGGYVSQYDIGNFAVNSPGVKGWP